MKKRLLKTTLFFFSVSVLMCIMIFSASAKTVKYGNSIFDVGTKSATLVQYNGKATDVKIPSKVKGVKVTAIGTEAFWQNKTMKTVSIPSTVTSIGIAAFNECTALKKVVIPYKVKTIGESAFWYCTNLKTVVIPKATEKIGKNAFKGCSSLTAYVTKGSYAETYIKKQTSASIGYRYMSAIKLSGSELTVNPGKTVKLTVTASPSVVYLKKFTYSSSNKNVATVDSKGNIKGVSCGVATITVKTADGSNLSKQCKVNVVPGTITKLKQSDVTATGYTLSWSAVKGATHYKLYKYNSTTKKWNGLGTTDKLSYKVSKLTAGTNNYYKIMAYARIGNFNFCGKTSQSFKFKTAVPAKVTKLTASASGTSKVTLKWQKAEFATGYRVYIYNTKTKKYDLNLETKNLSAQLTELTPGTKYRFTVRSYVVTNGKKVLGSAKADDVYCTTRPDYVTNLTADSENATYTSIKLSWKDVRGVSGYRVSMWNESKNAYETLKNIYGEENTSYTVENLEKAKEYKFTVRTFIKDGSTTTFGYNCTAVTGKTKQGPDKPAVVTGLCVDESATTFTSLKLKWDAIKGVSGYRVSMWNESKNTYEHLKYIYGEENTSFTVESLEKAKEYKFIVRAFVKEEGATVYGDSCAALIASTKQDPPKPAVVTGLCADEDATTFTSLKLKWDVLNGASGYRLSMWNEETNAYEALATLEGKETTVFTVEDLESDKEYKFTVAAFVKEEDVVVYGDDCTAVTARTQKAPATDEDAFNSFIQAYNSTRTSENISMFFDSQYAADDIVAPGRNYYESVISSVFVTKDDMYSFVDGVDILTGKTLTSLVSPADTVSALTFSNIKADSFEHYEDGKGYRVKLELNSEQAPAAVNSLIAPTIDWDKIAQENPGFTLNSCTYEGTVIEAKVQADLVDDIRFYIPVSVSFNLGEDTYSFSGTIIRDYVFVKNS